MIKILALGAIGYAAYRYFEAQRGNPADVRLAGGPLSEHATIQKSADQPPALVRAT